MRYDLEEAAKVQLYLEYQKKHFKSGMKGTQFTHYIQELIKYVEKNFHKRYEELIKKER